MLFATLTGGSGALMRVWSKTLLHVPYTHYVAVRQASKFVSLSVSCPPYYGDDFFVVFTVTISSRQKLELKKWDVHLHIFLLTGEKQGWR